MPVYSRAMRRPRLQSSLYSLMVLGLIGGTASAQTAPDAPTPSSGTAAVQTTATPAATTAKPKDDKAKPKDPKDSKDPKDTKDTKAADQATAGATADTTAGDDTTTVTVTGQKPLNRIDRQVYDNTKDPDSKTGTALDALAKMPGVNVDPSGVVTFRGKEPEILINGRPAPQLQGGDNRAAALQAMSSGSITSMELVANPGAQYGSGSSSTVINLITTEVQPPGGYLSTQLRSSGGNVSGNGHFQVGKLNLSASLNSSGDAIETRSGSERHSLDAGGNILRSSQGNNAVNYDSNSINASLNASYLLGRKDSLSASLGYYKSSNSGGNHSNTVYYNPAGVATDIFSSLGTSDSDAATQTAALGWSHTGDKPGETLKIDWRASQGLTHYATGSHSQYVLSAVASNLAGYQSHNLNKSKTGNSAFNVDYVVPIGDDQLQTGLQLTTDTSQSRSQFSAPNAVVTLSNSEFDYRQSVSAFYGIYQKPLGDHWTVQGGLRVELFDLDGTAPLVGLKSHVSNTTYNPSFFATYVVSEKAKFRLNYSHRLARPFASYYNPQTIQNSLTNITVGQTRLKPQVTDSFEAGYEFTTKPISYQLRGYYSHETGFVIDVSSYVPDPLNLGNLVLRTSRTNAGTRDIIGSEFNLNDKLTPKLTLNLNANLSNTSFDTPNFNGTKSVSGLQGRIGLSYQPNKKDWLSMNYTITPKMLFTQGYRSGYGQVGLQYQHKFTPTVTLTASFNDLARSSKTWTYTTTPTVDGFSVSSRQAPTFYLSLSKNFGVSRSSSSSITVTRPGAISTGGPVGAASATGGIIGR